MCSPTYKVMIFCLRLTKKALLSLCSPSKCSFTLSKLRFFGLRKPKNSSFYSTSHKRGCPFNTFGSPSKNARHTGPRVARSSAHAVAGQHPSFLPRLPLQAFLPCAGCCETHSARVFKENYTRAPLKHSHTMACTRQGSTLSQLRCRRSFEVTFVRDIYCELFIALIGCCFCLLHFSCPLSQGGRDSLLPEGDDCRFAFSDGLPFGANSV